MAGHNATLVCRQLTADLINREGTEVRIKLRGEKDHRAVRSTDLPGRITAATPENCDPRDYDLVVLAMQEPQYSHPTLRALLARIAEAEVPCLSIMNMPPLAFLKRIPGINIDRISEAYSDPAIWAPFQPGLVTLCSPDPQAFRPDDVRLDGHQVPVKLRVFDSLFVPMAKWSMLMTGNYRCVLDKSVRSIAEAVNLSPSSVARAILAGAPIERVDKLIQVLAQEVGQSHLELDKTVARIDAALADKFVEDVFFTKSIQEADPEIAGAIDRELGRQRVEIELIASENIVSLAVLDAAGSVLTNKYAEGYPGRRYYGGCQHVDEVEDLAISRACKLFGCDFANVQPNSGSQANQGVFLALAKPGDTILGLSLDAGGHLTHGARPNMSGKWFNAVAYGLNADDRIDYDPLEHAHVATTTTHKTLRGPRGGMILTNDQTIAKKVNSAIFPGLQGGPLMHAIAGKAVAFGEALQPTFRTYSAQVIENAAALADNLFSNGFDIVSGGTDTHLMLVDLRPKGVKGNEAEAALGRALITCNKNGVPGDPEKPTVTSGIRLGSPAGTTRGFKVAEFRMIGDMITGVLDGLAKNGPEGNAKVEAAVRSDVEALCDQFPIYHNI